MIVFDIGIFLHFPSEHDVGLDIGTDFDLVIRFLLINAFSILMLNTTTMSRYPCYSATPR